MKSLLNRKIAIIGGGVIGKTIAWHLRGNNHQIIIFDPKLKKDIDRSGPLNGSSASLGVLMGNIFSKSSGRGWKLRRRSMELWPEWIKILQKSDQKLIIKKPLLKIARSSLESLSMEKLAKQRKDLGIRLLKSAETKKLIPYFPTPNYGGIISYEDGKIDPIRLQKCLMKELRIQNIELISQKVIKIERNNSPTPYKWSIKLNNESIVGADQIIICAARESSKLLEKIGHKIQIGAILGQALTLNINSDFCKDWPAVVNTNSFNLIPNYDNKLTIGATLENSFLPSKVVLQNMKTLNGLAPKWIQEASIHSQWHGFRAKPLERFAPVLEELEPGLIVATGHYRNGILLAPATAEWVAKTINKN